MDFENVKDVLGARLVMLVERGDLEPVEVVTAKIALMKVFRDGDADLMNALKNALWLDETVAEVGPPPVREGIDNDGLTDAEATAALDEQATWPQDEFGREIDPGLKR